MTYIDAPQLDNLLITFFNRIDFDSPQLAQFISRTPIRRDRDAHVDFDDSTASIRLSSPLKDFAIEISCSEPDWQLSSVAQVCNFCLPPLTMVEDLYIEHRYSQLVWQNDAIENTLWLELLLLFFHDDNERASSVSLMSSKLYPQVGAFQVPHSLA